MTRSIAMLTHGVSNGQSLLASWALLSLPLLCYALLCWPLPSLYAPSPVPGEQASSKFQFESTENVCHAASQLQKVCDTLPPSSLSCHVHNWIAHSSWAHNSVRFLIGRRASSTSSLPRSSSSGFAWFSDISAPLYLFPYKSLVRSFLRSTHSPRRLSATWRPIKWQYISDSNIVGTHRQLSAGPGINRFT